MDRTEKIPVQEQKKIQKRAKKNAKPKMKKQMKIIAVVMSVISIVLAAVLGFMLWNLNMLPALYFGIAMLVLLLLVGGISALILGARKVQVLIIGIVCSLIFDVIMGGGIYYLNGAASALKKITTTKTEIALVDVYVNADDTAETIEDANGYRFGILSELDRENTDEAVSKINEDLGYEIETAEYGNYMQMVDAVEANEIDAFILNTAYMEILADMEGYQNISERVKSIAEYEVEHKTEISEKPVVEKTSDTFTVYVSGIDSREGLVAKSRSDVNIIMTINTKTKQVLLVNTPRDYYVPLPISGGNRDKLTHAGIYGVETSMGTLEMLYGVNLDYYFRLNFGGFETIIDALGGITVYSEYSFVTWSHQYYIQEGENYLNGAEALDFVRERYALPGGDHDRGKNQMKVIKAMIQKMTSTDFLLNYSNVLNALAGSFETSIPMDLISEIVKAQLSDGG
ncbi:MAG: LCP family protein, partial [Bulleidia sp.]|nr:LCP family protein [Bulleidia sp.]